MRTQNFPLSLAVAGCISAVLALPIGVSPGPACAQGVSADAVKIGAAEIGGTVTGANGPEAGVWVIAETTGLPTPFAKIVVTDGQGR